MPARRLDGHIVMKQLYDDLGIFKPLEWHRRADDDNIAHNWNQGESMSSILRKLKDGTGEWDPSLKHAIQSGQVTTDQLNSVETHYMEQAGTAGRGTDRPTSGAGAYKEDVAEATETTRDYWSGAYSEFKVEGKGLDMSPHDSAAYSYYASERIDQGLSDKEYNTFATADAIEDVEQRFLDEVYNNRETGEVSASVEAHWGLDLRRIDKPGLDADESDTDVRSDEYYEHLTKGEVNWASYIDDPKYQAAFQELNLDISKLGSRKDVASTAEYVSQIRQVNKETDVIQKLAADDGDGWKRNRKGKYDPDEIVSNEETGELWIKGERQISALEKYGRKQGEINPDTGKEWTAKERGRLLDPRDYPINANPIIGPKTPVVKPDIKINKVKVKRPANIPASWGSVGE